jgi:hypothetical protein
MSYSELIKDLQQTEEGQVLATNLQERVHLLGEQWAKVVFSLFVKGVDGTTKLQPPFDEPLPKPYYFGDWKDHLETLANIVQGKKQMKKGAKGKIYDTPQDGHCFYTSAAFLLLQISHKFGSSSEINAFEEAQEVLYHYSEAKWVEAIIKKVHPDTENLCYTILVKSTQRERQTTAEKLTPTTRKEPTIDLERLNLDGHEDLDESLSAWVESRQKDRTQPWYKLALCARKLRVALAKQQRNMGSRFEQWLKRDQNKRNVKSGVYTKTMANIEEAEWAGNLEAFALSALFEVNVLYHLYDEKTRSVKIIQTIPSPPIKERPTVHLLYNGINHYSAYDPDATSNTPDDPCLVALSNKANAVATSKAAGGGGGGGSTGPQQIKSEVGQENRQLTETVSTIRETTTNMRVAGRATPVDLRSSHGQPQFAVHRARVRDVQSRDAIGTQDQQSRLEKRLSDIQAKRQEVNDALTAFTESRRTSSSRMREDGERRLLRIVAQALWRRA